MKLQQILHQLLDTTATAAPRPSSVHLSSDVIIMCTFLLNVNFIAMEMAVIGIGRMASIEEINYMLTRDKLTAINNISIFFHTSHRCRTRIRRYSFDGPTGNLVLLLNVNINQLLPPRFRRIAYALSTQKP
jgi:hypothetical protein